MKRRNHLVRWLAAGVLAAGPVLVAPSAALARQDTPEKEVVDARLEGYSANPTLPAGSNGLTWVAMVILGVLCCAGLFKDAKRTHLD